MTAATPLLESIDTKTNDWLTRFKALLKNLTDDDLVAGVDASPELASDASMRFFCSLGDELMGRGLFADALSAYRRSLQHGRYTYALLGLLEAAAFAREPFDSSIFETSRAALLGSEPVAIRCIYALARHNRWNEAQAFGVEAINRFRETIGIIYALAKVAQHFGNVSSARYWSLRLESMHGDDKEAAARIRKEFRPQDESVEFSYRGKSFVVTYPEFASDLHRKSKTGFGELRILEWLCENQVGENRTILDIGCHIGNHSLFFTNFLNAKRVIGFDAARNAARYYCVNVPNAIFYNVAVGLEDEEVPLYGDIFNYRFGQSQVAGNRYIRRPEVRFVRTRAIDSFNFGDVGLIKIDVEGWEINVIRGARETIIREKPILMLEILKGNYDYYIKEITSIIGEFEVLKRFGSDNDAKSDIIIRLVQ